MIVGIDEVGRGPWAGPLVFGAVVLGKADIEGLTDSKKLTTKRRVALSNEIYKKAEAVGLGWVHPDELDSIGLGPSLSLACRRALEQIAVPYQQIIIDGTVNFLKDTGKGPFVTTIKQADLLVPSVSAASIVAKVARDIYMTEQDVVYPGYGFDVNVGYGTAAHRDALHRLGVTPLHRQSFAPIASFSRQGIADTPVREPTIKTTKIVGDTAEQAAVDFLKSNGYQVCARNWKTKACEIDIVATKSGVIHFVEVKYRKQVDQGGGFAAITPRKLRQMERAAKIWFMKHGERDARLSAVEVTGENFAVTSFVSEV